MTRMTIALALVSLAAAAHAAPPADDAWIAELEGGWSGGDNMTPLGRMPFALLFERDADGSLHARTSLNRDTWVDLRFREDAAGRWLLQETAAMEGLGVQQYTLEPVAAPGELRRWVWPEKPDFLSVDIGGMDDAMFMKVTLRGEDHVQFDLARLPEAEVAALRVELAAAATLPPAAQSIRDLENDDEIPVVILEARAAIAASPRDAGAHLRLGRAIGKMLQVDPMDMGPRYAGEMLAALKSAVELDPTNSEAYHWLGGYYLNAPPIAGGSLDAAERVARDLAKVDSEGGATLLARIEKKRRGSSNGY